MDFLDVVLFIVGLPFFFAALYLFVLALFSVRKAPPPPVRSLKFDLLIPSHNEEGGIEATVRDARALDYPAENFRVVVVADNCTDRTAELAEKAGALVWPRQNQEKRGKGYALEMAF